MLWVGADRGWVIDSAIASKRRIQVAGWSHRNRAVGIVSWENRETMRRHREVVRHCRVRVAPGGSARNFEIRSRYMQIPLLLRTPSGRKSQSQSEPKNACVSLWKTPSYALEIRSAAELRSLTARPLRETCAHPNQGICSRSGADCNQDFGLLSSIWLQLRQKFMIHL
jgi:hypothetical protein